MKTLTLPLRYTIYAYTYIFIYICTQVYAYIGMRVFLTLWLIIRYYFFCPFLLASMAANISGTKLALATATAKNEKTTVLIKCDV